VQGEREYIFLLGYLTAEVRGHRKKDQIEYLRLAFLMFIEPVIGLEVAIDQLVAVWLDGQPVLFRDTAVKLAEQLKMATSLSTWFNMLAVEVGATEIDLEQVRNNLRPTIESQVSKCLLFSAPSKRYTRRWIRHSSFSIRNQVRATTLGDFRSHRNLKPFDVRVAEMRGLDGPLL